MRSTAADTPSISASFQQLSQEAIDKLIVIRSMNSRDKIAIQRALKNIYRPQDCSADAEFFRKHTFEVLSAGNTLNIKIMNISTKETKVLGIGIQMSDNQCLPENLRSPLAGQGVVAPKYPVTRHKTGHYNFGLTEYYCKGSFNVLYESKPSALPAELHEDCAIYTQKMAEKLQVLQQAKVFFPDAKAPNWLLDSKNNLVIADEKSLRSFDQAKAMNFFIHTSGYWPLGIVNSKTSEDFEKIHAYVLGANIYEYLTCEEPPEKQLSSSEHFKADVFKGDIGQRYKTLILNLTNPDASKRMGLADATTELKQIQYDMQYGIKLGGRPEEMARKEAVTKLYPQAKVAATHRYFAYNADVNVLEGYDNFKAQYQAFKGDQLKAEILINLKSRIDKVATQEDLSALKLEIMGDKKANRDSSPEFKILEKHQGLISNVFKKTTSHQALETMFTEKEASFSSTPALNKGN